MIAKVAVCWRDWLMPTLTLSVFCAVLIFLYHKLNTLDFRDIVDQALAMPLAQIGLSFVLMICAYLALTVYEALAIRYVKATIAYPRVAFTAFLAYAVGHNVGMTFLSGGALRYRIYSLAGLSTTQIAKIILFGVVTFGLGMGLLVGSALLIEPAALWESIGVSPMSIKLAGIAFLSLSSVYYFWALWFKTPLNIKHLSVKPPSRNIVLAQGGISAIDLILACSVLYVLLPSDYGISFIQFLPLFLVAIGLGILSSVPGGIGVFETVLLLALPDLPKESLLSAILVYRVVYFLIPLLFALIGFAVHEVHHHRKIFSGIGDDFREWVSGSSRVSLQKKDFVVATDKNTREQDFVKTAEKRSASKNCIESE